MTERGLPIVDGAPACPFVAFDDARDDRADHPDPRHRCYAESPPTPRARAHQEAYCLSANFPVCPTFQDWARREAARVLPSAGAGSPAERLRDVPAQRTAGERPPAFGPLGGAGQPGGVDLLVPGGFPEASPDPQLDARPGEPVREPWELPPRRPAQHDWSAPPPWAPTAAPVPDEVDAPGFLRTGSSAAPAGQAEDAPVWLREAPDDGDGAADPTADREASMARLRAMGMGDAGPGDAVDSDADAADGSMDEPRPVPGITRSVDPVTGRAVGIGRPAGMGAPGPAVDTDAVDGIPTDSPNGGRRSARGLAGLLGWDRRPKVGSSRPARKPEREPAWERPRRFEAYPTLKTRVGVPMPSRLLLAAAAVVAAALVLFFVPPLFLKQDNSGAAPGASRTPAPSGSGVLSSAPPSVGPTAKPSPGQRTYTVKQGDTLSTIAKRFNVTVDQILAANKNIKNPNKIAIGDVIVIPAALPSEVVDGGAPTPT